jgi:hypothetical protein
MKQTDSTVVRDDGVAGSNPATPTRTALNPALQRPFIAPQHFQTWTRDERRCAYICSDGRVVTDETLANLDPFVAGMLKQVLDESAPFAVAP